VLGFDDELGESDGAAAKEDVVVVIVVGLAVGALLDAAASKPDILSNDDLGETVGGEVPTVGRLSVALLVCVANGVCG